MKDLKSLENKLFLSYFEDGIVDLLIGVMFIFDGLLMLTENTKFVGLAIIFTLLISPFKKKFIIPRIGFVKFRVTREHKIKKSMFVLLIAGILAFNIVLYFLTAKGNSNFLQDYAFIFLGMFMAMPPLFGAFFTGVKRFYLYAVLIFLVFFHENFTHSTAPIDFMIFGAVLSGFGLFYLVKFLQKYPLPINEAENV